MKPARGTNRFGIDTARQVVTAGNAQRPVFAGNLTLSYFPFPNLSATNQTTLNNVRIDGNSVYLQFDNATQAANFAAFEFLGIRTFANETTLDFRMTHWLGLYGGYQYSDRQIRSQEFSKSQGGAFNALSQQTNILHEGLFGIRLTPAEAAIHPAGRRTRARQPAAQPDRRTELSRPRRAAAIQAQNILVHRGRARKLQHQFGLAFQLRLAFQELQRRRRLDPTRPGSPWTPDIPSCIWTPPAASPTSPTGSP